VYGLKLIEMDVPSNGSAVGFKLTVSEGEAVSHSFSKTSVMLPEFGPGRLDQLDDTSRGEISKKVGLASRGSSAAAVSVRVEWKDFDPSNVVTAANPTLADSSKLDWSGANQLAPGFTAVDDSLESIAANKVVFLGIILGIAAAAGLSAVETIL